MKVVAINSSPHQENSTTDLILQPFLEGMTEGGAEIELFYTKKMDIHPCIADLHCWIKAPGKCCQKDDMQMLLPKLIRADVLVLASPVYWDGVNGPMKNLLDRMTPMGKPFLELQGGHTRHAPRERIEGAKLVLVSNCGFWELDNFDPMLAHMKAVSKNMHRVFSGALLRPHGPALNIVREQGVLVDRVFKAAKEAGLQLVREGHMPDDTLTSVSSELMPREQYIKIFSEPR